MTADQARRSGSGHSTARGVLIGAGLSAAVFVLGLLFLYAGTHRDGDLYAVLRVVAIAAAVVAFVVLAGEPARTEAELRRRGQR